MEDLKSKIHIVICKCMAKSLSLSKSCHNENSIYSVITDTKEAK